jgi:hypothetical protein
MKVINTLCDSCGGQGKLYEWGKLEGTDLPTRILKGTCEVCKGECYIPYVMFTLDEAKAILGKCGIGERYEADN